MPKTLNKKLAYLHQHLNKHQPIPKISCGEDIRMCSCGVLIYQMSDGTYSRLHPDHIVATKRPTTQVPPSIIKRYNQHYDYISELPYL